MKFIFEPDSTKNKYGHGYSDDYEVGIEDRSAVHAVALDLLSIEEAERLPKPFRQYREWWWLRSHGYTQYDAAYVNYLGSVRCDGHDVSDVLICIRPVLTLSNLGSFTLKLYKEYTIFDKKWIYIGKDGFLYNGEKVYHRFDGESNEYGSSEIKKFLNDWLKKLKNKDLTVEEI